MQPAAGIFSKGLCTGRCLEHLPPPHVRSLTSLWVCALDAGRCRPGECNGHMHLLHLLRALSRACCYVCVIDQE